MKMIPLRKFLAIAVLVVSLASSGLAATLTVTNLNDSGAGSLRQAISNAASTGDEIVFAPGVTGTITLASELFFTKSLTIAGPGAANLTVSGNNATRVFSVSSGEITISGLRIANGFTTGNPNANLAGGGIYNSSARLTVRNCEIANNVHTGGPDTTGFPVTGQGGGIWHIAGGDAATGGRLLLQNCLFIGNQAIGGTGFNATSAGNPGGDAAPGQGGGLFIYPLSSNSVTIQDCTFTNNAAIGGTGGNGMGTGARGRGGRGQGGAVFVGENTSLVARRSSFNNNDATGGNRGTGIDTASTNSAEGQGGAIYVVGFGFITDCTLDANQATGGPGIAATALIGAAGQGGGLFFGSGLVNLTRSTVINNVAEGGAGGAGGGTTSKGEGGGLFIRFNGNQFTLHATNTTIALNTARAGNAEGTASGGGIWTEDRLNVTNSTIAFNSVSSTASNNGGGLRASAAGPTTLRNTLIAKNLADNGAPDATGPVDSSSSHNLIGIGSGVGTPLTGITNGTNNNQIGTTAAPIDPKMQAPLLQGGFTKTCSIDPDSPAVNAGTTTNAPVTDQRLFIRSGPVDIGAFEFGGTELLLKIVSISRVGNGPIVLDGLGAPNAVHTIQSSPDLSFNSFTNLGTTTANGSGQLQYTDTGAPALTQRFYRLPPP